MYPRKGVIGVGSDADVVLWDPERSWRAEDLPPVSPRTFSLYDGLTGKGLPRHVLIGGVMTVEDGRFVGAKGQGRFVRRLAVGRSPDKPGLFRAN
jgi:dihydropyrimidinase